MSSSHNTPTDSANIWHGTDVLSSLYDGILRYSTDAFVGPHSRDRNPYLSPGSADPAMDSLVFFKGFPRTFICIGECERLVDQAKVLRDRMVRDMGQDMVRYEEVAATVHGFLATASAFPVAREATLKKIEEWLRQTR